VPARPTNRERREVGRAGVAAGAAVVHNIASLFVVINSGRLLTYRAGRGQAAVKTVPALHPT